MACRTGCKTKNCASYGECCRNAAVRTTNIGDKVFTREGERRWFGELAAYDAARKEGIEPDGTTYEAIDRARRISDMTGKPYNGERPMDCFIKE